MTRPVPLDVRILEIEWAVELGATSLKDIAGLINISMTELSQILAGSEINYKELKIEKARKDIRHAIELGTENLEEIAEMTGLSCPTIRKYSAGDDTIKLPKPNYECLRLPEKEERKRIRLIKRGLSSGEIGRRCGEKNSRVSRQGVKRFINNRGLYDEWRESREHYKNKTSWKLKEKEDERRKAGKRLYHVLEAIIEQKLEKTGPEERLAFEKTGEYISSKEHPKISTTKRKGHKISDSEDFFINRLFNFFKRYYKAESEGKKASINELCDELLMVSFAGKILKTVGLEPPNGKRERKKVPEEKKEAIKRAALKSELPYADIAYLIRLPRHVVTQNSQRYLKKIGKERPKIKPWIKAFGIPGKEGVRISLTYSMAGQIYEARDLGFTKQETMELLDISNERVLEHAMKFRKKEIAPKIISALRILYPEKNITKPYVDFVAGV